MERILQTHHFGPHQVDVVEHLDDDGVAGFSVLVDQEMVSDVLPDRPDLEALVRLYAAWQSRRAAG